MGGAGAEVRETGGVLERGSLCGLAHGLGNLIGNLLKALGGGEGLVKGTWVTMAPDHWKGLDRGCGDVVSTLSPNMLSWMSPLH